jgi:hypothetical protein
MKPSKTIPGNLLYPPKWVICTAPAASFAALIFVFAFRQEESAVAHPIFLLSAYSLAILIAALPKFAGRFTRLGTGLLKHSTAGCCKRYLPLRLERGICMTGCSAAASAFIREWPLTFYTCFSAL